MFIESTSFICHVITRRIKDFLNRKIPGNSKFKLVQESDVAAVFSSQFFLNFGNVALSLLFGN